MGQSLGALCPLHLKALIQINNKSSGSKISWTQNPIQCKL